MRALALSLLVLAGCSADDADDAPVETADAATAPADTASADTGLPADLAGLNLQTNHATGSVLRVTGVRFANDHIAVDIEFTNGSDHEQELNQYSNDDFVVRDDLGNVYNISPPANNGDVAVPAGQSINGEFVFLGRIHPDATRLTLVTNERLGDDADTSRDPKMTIQIPLATGTDVADPAR
ncbi:MAG TPA: hypothetical protein VF576_05380 [Rubricoccaceae bacterium]